MSASKRKKATADKIDLVSITVRILVGSLLSVICYFVLAAIFSLISYKTDFDSSIYRYFVLFSGAVAGIIGGYFAVRKIRKNGIIIGAVSAIPAFFIIFLISSVISRTGISTVGWITAGIMTLFSAIGGIISANKRK